MKLGIGLPLTDEKVHSGFLDSWVLMEKPEFIYLRPQFPGKIDDIRNQLVDKALDLGCTHLLMMDTDQNMPPDTITKMLSHDKDVVAAKVHRRYPPFDPIMYRGEHAKYTQVPDKEILNNPLVEVDATGCGCVLYKTEVFRTIKRPWFQFRIGENGKPVGEDINFCQKLKKHGYKIYVDTTIDTGHFSIMEVNWSSYQLYKFLKKVQRGNDEKSSMVQK